MRRNFIIFICTLTLGCHQQLELTTESLAGSWGYLDEDARYTELHFNDTLFAVHLEDVGLQGFYYWIQNDTILRANGQDSRIPIAIVKNLTRNRITFEGPGTTYELERLNNVTELAFERLLTDSLNIPNPQDFQERSMRFYKNKGIERTTLFHIEDDFEDEESDSTENDS